MLQPPHVPPCMCYCRPTEHEPGSSSSGSVALWRVAVEGSSEAYQAEGEEGQQRSDLRERLRAAMQVRGRGGRRGVQVKGAG